jgi:hypothetical protein
MKRTLLAAVACLALATGAHAASVTLPFTVSPTVTTPPSTGITCTPIATGLVAGTPAVAGGATLTTCTVAPSNWNGAVAVSDGNVVAVMTSATMFKLNVAGTVTGLAAGSYSEVVTSVP